MLLLSPFYTSVSPRYTHHNPRPHRCCGASGSLRGGSSFGKVRSFGASTYEPDDDDIACLAGFLSTALEDSEEEDDDEGLVVVYYWRDPRLVAAEEATKQAQGWLSSCCPPLAGSVFVSTCKKMRTAERPVRVVDERQIGQ
jgi:hypothetical protein